MKKLIIILTCAIFVTACKNTDSASHTEQVEGIPTEEKVSMEEPKEEEEPSLGAISEEYLQQEPYSEWYNTYYDEFNAEESVLNEIENHIDDYKIIAFMGLWCGDSHREVPQFLHLLEEVNYNMDNFEMYSLDYDKQSPSGVEDSYDIDYVPTFIFLKDGKEVNRIVEYPQETLAKDVLKIVTGADYKHPYAE